MLDHSFMKVRTRVEEQSVNNQTENSSNCNSNRNENVASFLKGKAHRPSDVHSFAPVVQNNSTKSRKLSGIKTIKPEGKVNTNTSSNSSSPVFSTPQQDYKPTESVLDWWNSETSVSSDSSTISVLDPQGSAGVLEFPQEDKDNSVVLWPGESKRPLTMRSVVESGLGTISIQVFSNNDVPLHVLVEDSNKRHHHINDDSLFHNGFLFQKDGSVLYDLSKVKTLRRALVLTSGYPCGTMVVKSNELGWNESYDLDGVNGSDNTISLLMIYYGFGKISLRQCFMGFNSPKQLAQFHGFESLNWRDNFTPVF